VGGKGRTGRARLAQRDNRVRRKPFWASLVVEKDKKKINDNPEEKRTRAKRRPLARESGVNLKVSRAAEKLAHLISNGSFNNILFPRAPLRPY